MMTEPSFLGDIAIWHLPKTAFLSSDKFSAGSVLKSYDWASEMKRMGRCVISGFHSKLERDVLEILLHGAQPIIQALAYSIPARPPARIRPLIESGRMLLVSPFPPGIGRPNRDLALKRNQFTVDNAVEIVFAHVHPGGMLEKLKLPPGLPLRLLDNE